MFFNAMKKKQWNPEERDMQTVVPIHNVVNEKCWAKVLEWESLSDSSECGGPKLVKFKGRPTDYTIKARMRQILGYSLPFDRHDWVVDRCGKEVTYIIDFYSGAKSANESPSFFLDVRPSITLDGCIDRIRKYLRDGDGIW